MEDQVYKSDIEKAKVFTVKQVLSLMGATAFVVFVGTGIWWRFQSMEVEIQVLKGKHQQEMKNLKAEGSLGFTMMQSSVDAVSDKIETIDAKLDKRISTIRDRQNARLDKLEETGSDKNPK